MTPYKAFQLPVPGGVLHGGVWGEQGPVVLCSHGTTSNHIIFEALAAQLGSSVRVVAPDHRGRGRSMGIHGPWGMRAHAADLVATLDHLGIERADLLLGHSMGGFVAAVTAAQYPKRVGRVLLVDGGLPTVDRIPWFLPASLLPRLVLGRTMKRLDMSFASREAYHSYWRKHPALAQDWSVWVERYLDYDLAGEPPQMYSSTRKDCLLGDTRSLMDPALVRPALENLTAPLRFLRAPRGMENGKPVYSEKKLETWAARLRGLTGATIADVNHFTILLSERGAAAVAAEVRQLLG